MPPSVALEVPTELIVEVADSVVEVVSSPVGRGLPEQRATFVLTVPPLPVPVEKQLMGPGAWLYSWSVPAENLFELLAD
jgi:hypothetical protein